MSSVLVQSLIFATSGLFSIGSITLVIVLLISDSGWHNGISYALGYFCSYLLIGMLVVGLKYQLSGETSEKSTDTVQIFLIIMGILLLLIALHTWRKPASENRGESRFISLINKITPKKAFGFGALVTIINFKNLLFYLTAISVVAFSDLAISDRFLITFLDTFIFCFSIFLPVLLYLIFPKHGDNILERFKNFLVHNGRAISIFLLVLFGLIFIIKGVIEL